MALVVFFIILGAIHFVQVSVGSNINFTRVNQSSEINNKRAQNAIDGDLFSFSKTEIGLNESWWGTFEAPTRVVWIFIGVGQGHYSVFVGDNVTYQQSALCASVQTPSGSDITYSNSSCKNIVKGNTMTVRRIGNGSLVLYEITPVGCPQNCKDGCINGPCKECIREHYGPMCNKKCIQVCTDNTCDIEKGECLKENIVVAVIFGICVLVIIACGVGFFIKRRAKFIKLFKLNARPSDDDEIVVTYSRSERYVERPNTGIDTRAPAQVPTSPTSNCPVEYVHMIDGQNSPKLSPDELIKYLEKRQNEESLLQDLARLPGWMMGRCFEAEREENKAKNRSSTLLPYDRNRVVLQPMAGIDNTGDYINASYIAGHGREKAYILTFGPFSTDTKLDFWRMVWQTNSTCIVMLTALREGEKKKCLQYWPEESEECGPFFILIRNTETFEDYVIRHILLRKREETRRLTQFQLTTWGENKRRRKIDSLLRLRCHVNSVTYSDKVPTIIHSGPGISRIGTYISIDILLQKGSEDGVIDIIDTIVKLRSQRAYLLNTRKEHQFLFSALKAGFSHDSRDDERDEKDEKDDESIEEIYVNEHSKADVYYEDGEEVVLWMNTVGPYHNRQETYSYFSLPFCAGPKESIGHYHETLGEALQGTELEFSGLDIDFKGEVKKTEYCTVELNEEKYQAFVYAVKNHYWYQMYIDDLPIWGIVGEISENGDDYYVWTHKKFDIGYNGKQIVDVNLTSEAKKKLTAGAKISFSYEVHFTASKIKFDKRFDKYLDPNFFQHRIHWFSIFNSFMMVIFLVGLVSMILMRTLRKDYARYSKEEDLDDMEKDLGDEYGWKQVHGDVFRPASNSLLFSSLVGTGYHIAVVSLCVIVFSILGDLYTERGSLLSTAIFVYAATSPVNGYFGGSLYARMGGKVWIKQMMVGAFMLPVAVCGTAFFINFIAIYYHASRAIPFGTMVAVTCICIFVILPLTLVGTVLGRNLAGQPNYPCRVNAVPRPIPEKKWFMEPAVIIFLGGILPFGSIFIEMYFIFTSFWAYKIYYVYGFMLLVFVILTIVTVCVTIVCTYFLLNAEDYRWQWTSFSAAASTAGYVYLYSFYYFFFKTKMYGFFQTTFYFGYMALFSLALGIMCGTFGYIGTSYFVRKIYSTVKID
uniref:Uncharacterized protein LOC111120053 n=1 Tax=Crassostrea virginica TaxID=6565 RepID=A0A8B8CKN9_CRAVI|nr:uncharacterized protein LOC111120053 [Crassostrea virginica]